MRDVTCLMQAAEENLQRDDFIVDILYPAGRNLQAQNPLFCGGRAVGNHLGAFHCLH